MVLRQKRLLICAASRGSVKIKYVVSLYKDNFYFYMVELKEAEKPIFAIIDTM